MGDVGTNLRHLLLLVTLVRAGHALNDDESMRMAKAIAKAIIKGIVRHVTVSY